MIEGSAPPGAKLRLRKAFETPTSQSGVVVDDLLNTSLRVPLSGNYRWHVNPSSRPLVAGERWTMVCVAPGGARGVTRVTIGRGQQLTVNWDAACTS